MSPLGFDLDGLAPRRDAQLQRWVELEAPYWAARESPAVLRARRFGTHPVLITAPHAGRQLRDGVVKPTDGGTGGLSELLAQGGGAAQQAACGMQRIDPARDPDDNLFKVSMLPELRAGVFTVDLHGMRDDHRVDMCIGLGLNPTARTALLAQQMVRDGEARGLRMSINAPFSAAPWGTVTNFVQRQGGEGLQVEMARRLRPGVDQDEVAARAAIEVLLLLIQRAGSGRRPVQGFAA
jgi:hypothetical protein